MTQWLPPELAAAVRLGGEMGRRFAEFDWDAHPLGSPASWPVPVRSLVAVALTSRFPIVLWLGGAELFLVYNDGYIPMLSDKHPAALGRPGRQVWWEIWPEIAPMLAGVIASGEATWSDDLMLPLVTEGRARERYFTFSYSPIILGSGQVDGIFCAVAETTERVLGERRLHVLNAVAGAVMEARTVDAAVEAMARACGDDHPDLPFLAVYRNEGAGPARLRAATPRVAGRLPEDLTGPPEPRDAASVIELARWAPALGAVCERALVLPVGEPAPEQTSGFLVVGVNPQRPVDDQYGAFLRLLADQLTAALAAADSYRQQQQRAEALTELDRAKTAFLTNVSHEFRTPLTLLLGPLQDAIDAAGDPAQRDRLTMARRNGQRLLRLVNSLLEFSRIEAGRAALAPQVVDLGAVTTQLASSFAGLCERAGIELVLDCAPMTYPVDLDMWETIILNLLSNAVKFTHRGSITVRVEQLAGGARVRVVDTGVGIAEEDLGRLFERFYRASNAHGRSVEGSGVGLSLVRSLVDLHGGTIGVESAVDRGTTITIELPPTDVPPGGSQRAAGYSSGNAFVAEAELWLDRATAATATPGRRDGDRALVLIADDNADMRAHLHRILSQRWDTIVVGNGQAALEAVRQHRPDLVVTDVMMPMLDGFGFVRALRDEPDLAATPVLMLSARAGAEAAGDGFAAGADDYLSKPFSTAELLHRAEVRLNAGASRRAQQAEHQERVRQETAVADLVTAITAAESVDEMAAALLSGPLTAAAAAIAVRDPDTGLLTVHYAGAVTAEFSARYHRVDESAPVPIAEVVSTGQPMVIPDAALLDARFDQFVRDAATDVPAGVYHPLRDPAGAVTGALALLWPQVRQFDDATTRLVAQTAAVTSQALTRVTIVAREHRIATGFQEALLDLDRSSRDAVVGALYQPANEAMRVGGDWYLVTPVGPGKISVCVGDVVGHGLPAATVMGNLRAAVAATALSTPDPEHVLTTVQRYAGTVPGARCCSLAYATVDTAAGTIDYLCAGHPYPLIVAPNREARFLDGGRLPPLAALIAPTAQARPGHDALPPGSLLILYTDGLVERRGESLDTGLARLRGAAGRYAALPVDLMCQALLRELAPPGGYRDDVAILALRPAGVTANGFVTVLPADATELAPLRRRLAAWLADARVEPALRSNILIATGEAAVNAIEHGSRLDPTRTFSVEAFIDDDAITVGVSDTGQWHADTAASRRSGKRGLGLTLMHGMAGRVDTARSPQGTTVTLHFRRTAQPAGVSQ